MGVGWAVFRNYAEHAKEIKGDITSYPRFFLMPETSHLESDNEGNNVIYLPNPEEHVDHEVEMVIRLGEDLQPSQMCIGNDLTNRTRQTLAKEKGWPWLEGKGFRNSAILGTWTSWDEKPVEINLSINGELKQSASTELMIHSVSEILKTLTEWYGLSPGDLIWTGTPKGVSPLKKGDIVEAWMNNSEGKIISNFHAKCV